MSQEVNEVLKVVIMSSVSRLAFRAIIEQPCQCREVDRVIRNEMPSTRHRLIRRVHFVELVRGLNAISRVKTL